jgi:hypothetical protein
VCRGSHRSNDSRRAAAALATPSASVFLNGRRDGRDVVFLSFDEVLLEEELDDDDDEEDSDEDDDDDDDDVDDDDDDDNDEDTILPHEELDNDKGEGERREE